LDALLGSPEQIDRGTPKVSKLVPELNLFSGGNIEPFKLPLLLVCSNNREFLHSTVDSNFSASPPFSHSQRPDNLISSFKLSLSWSSPQLQSLTTSFVNCGPLYLDHLNAWTRRHPKMRPINQELDT
jgi:hypothetical protein